MKLLAALLILAMSASANAAEICRELFNDRDVVALSGLTTLPLLENRAQELLDQEVDKLYDSVDDDFSEESRRATFHRIQGQFYDSIDTSVRENERVVAGLLTMALRRLPFLKTRPFTIALSGSLTATWRPLLEQMARERGLQVEFELLPGSLSAWRADRNDLANSSEKHLLGRNVIFFDDSYATGSTAEVVKGYLEAHGADFRGGFFAFDAGSPDGSSLYRSSRVAARGPRLFDRSVPRGWKWTGGAKKLRVVGFKMLRSRMGLDGFQKWARLSGIELELADESKSDGVREILVYNSSRDLASRELQDRQVPVFSGSADHNPTAIIDRLVERGLAEPIFNSPIEVRSVVATERNWRLEATRDQKFLGYIRARRLSSNKIEIQDVDVKQDSRDQGVSTELFRALVARVGRNETFGTVLTYDNAAAFIQAFKENSHLKINERKLAALKATPAYKSRVRAGIGRLVKVEIKGCTAADCRAPEVYFESTAD